MNVSFDIYSRMLIVNQMPVLDYLVMLNRIYYLAFNFVDLWDCKSHLEIVKDLRIMDNLVQ